MLDVPGQRRPPCTRKRERYETLVDMALASTLRAMAGWVMVQASRCDGGTVEVVYER
jgi:hypothetical protein